MEHVSTLLHRAVSSTATPSETTGCKDNRPVLLSPESIVLLFQVFARRWTHRWEKTNVDQHARSVWLEDLRGLGVTDLNIGTGLHRCAKLPWPPSPAEFAEFCLPRAEDIGLPNKNDAYREAVWLASDSAAGNPLEPSHPAVWHAAQSVGLALLRENAEVGRREFGRVWPQVVDMVVQGKPLTPVPKALPKPKPEAVDPAVAAAARDAALAQLDSMFLRASA